MATDGSGVYGTLVITISKQIISVTDIVLTGTAGASTIATDNELCSLVLQFHHPMLPQKQLHGRF